jgi:DNA polymerase III subunit epsilon
MTRAWLWKARRMLAGPRTALDPGLERRVGAWLASARPGAGEAIAAGRWVIVDVETSGLDTDTAALIAIGALAVNRAEIDLADSFEVVLRQPEASTHDNILVHRITGSEQLGGMEPARALVAFLEFIGRSPLVAYHAPFDAKILQRALVAELGLPARLAWVDLAELAPLLLSGRATRLKGLDAWLDALAIPVVHRHRAITDCAATAALFLMAIEAAARQGCRTVADLSRLASSRRWIGN